MKRGPLSPSRRGFVTTGAAAIAAITCVKAPARPAQFEFKCATSLPLDHPIVTRGRQMWAAVERDSNGRIHTQFFPNSQLGGDAALLSQLRLGAVNFQFIAPSNFASVVPAVDISNIGFVFRDGEEAVRVNDGPLGAYLAREISAKGLYAFREMWASGMLQVGSNPRPIRVPADLTGFKIRIPDSKIYVDLFKELGATPIPLSLSELYTGLQTKVVDGEALALSTIESGKYFEVNKYVSITNHGWSGLWLIANGDTWKTIPQDLQAIIERNNARFALQERREIETLGLSLAAKLAGQGVMINQVDQAPFRQRLRSYYSNWANTFGATAWGLLQTSLGHTLV
jgi:TRAP-type transport system periplasmic protein